MGLHYPPMDGSLFFPEIVAFNARHNPHLPLYVFPKDDTTNEITCISYLEFYRACHRVAHALRPNRRGQDGQVIAIIASTDSIQYCALVVGVILAGYIPFPMSQRNSAPAVIDMLQKTSCHDILATEHTLRPLLNSVRSEIGPYELSIREIPTLAHCFPKLGTETLDDPFDYYPAPTTPVSPDDVMLYLHSSGSTGFPKCIPQTHLSVIHWCLSKPVTDNFLYPDDTRIGAMALPSFHTFGIAAMLYVPMVTLRSISLYRPTSFNDPNATPIIPTSDNIIDCIRRTNANALLVVPTFVEIWASTPRVVDTLKTLRYVLFSGGPLSEKLGDSLSDQGVVVRNIYGATELGPLSHIYRPDDDEQDWMWIRFGDRTCIRWVPLGEGTYECQILTNETLQPSVENLPDVKGYATSDIFLKHPTKEGLWKLVGRTDDVLVLASGEKTVPAPIECVVSSNPLVGGVVVFGRARNQVGILVEPREGCVVDVTDEQQLAEFRNKIWPEVEDANKDSPAFSRIFKEMILVTSTDKPLPRVGKGTVAKKAAMKLYENEIDTLYEAIEASTKASSDVPMPTSWSEEVLLNWLAVHATIVNSGKEVDPDIDLFDQGFDSLTATFLKNRIIGSLNSSDDDKVKSAVRRMDQNIIFNNPTVRLLARFTARIVSGSGSQAEGENDTVHSKTEIEKMIAKYSEGFPSPSSIEHVANGYGGHVVLLTGSTGTLGSYLLASLLENDSVHAIYAFNRPSRDGKTSEERQRAGLLGRGLDTSLLVSPKLRYLEGDATRDRLGLEEAAYDELRTSVDVIIHNAWRLDFNLSLSSFEPNIKGTRNLIDLALRSPRAESVRFLFTSSIASAQSWDKSKGPFPEEVQFDVGVAAGSGYGESKYVCERILQKSGLQVSSFRIGQISGGSPKGAWSVTDWVPILVKSSLALGALPAARGVVSWLPPHVVSDTILEVAFAKKPPPVAINIVHPRPVAWDGVLRGVGEALVNNGLTEASLAFVPFEEWVERLEKVAEGATPEDLGRIPAIKLLSFWQMVAAGDKAVRKGDSDLVEIGGGTAFSTSKAQEVSSTMKELQPLTAENVGLWVEYWKGVGMFL